MKSIHNQMNFLAECFEGLEFYVFSLNIHLYSQQWTNNQFNTMKLMVEAGEQMEGISSQSGKLPGLFTSPPISPVCLPFQHAAILPFHGGTGNNWIQLQTTLRFIIYFNPRCLWITQVRRILCIVAHKIALMIPSKCKAVSKASFKSKHVPVSQITQERFFCWLFLDHVQKTPKDKACSQALHSG